MIAPDLKTDLLRMVDLLFVNQNDLFEGPLSVVDAILEKHPEEVSLFVELFEQDRYPNDADRETLAIIILPHLAHPGVIEFLRSQEDCSDNEINELAGKGLSRTEAFVSGERP